VRTRPSKIVCVGRNYAAHAKELGNPVPERPLLFLKPPSSVIYNGESIVLPLDSQQVEHEGEIGVIINQRGRNIAEAEAMTMVSGFVPLNDVTARDLQKLDVQFTRAKGFDTFCPIGDEVPNIGSRSRWSAASMVSAASMAKHPRWCSAFLR
jgi:2-keto-4-pentenoate hydratase/2-oxohepta-3-ene-1,7-dioic acid hydratase in catechol pathway